MCKWIASYALLIPEKKIWFSYHSHFLISLEMGKIKEIGMLIHASKKWGGTEEMES